MTYFFYNTYPSTQLKGRSLNTLMLETPCKMTEWKPISITAEWLYGISLGWPVLPEVRNIAAIFSGHINGSGTFDSIDPISHTSSKLRYSSFGQFDISMDHLQLGKESAMICPLSFPVLKIFFIISIFLSFRPALNITAFPLSPTFSKTYVRSFPSLWSKWNSIGIAPHIWIPTVAVIHSGTLSNPRITMSSFRMPSFRNPLANRLAELYIFSNVI